MSHYPYKRVLLATEQTEFDVGAERIAFAMAQRCGAPLRVVIPVLSNPEYEAAVPEVALRIENDVAARVAGLRQRASEAGVLVEVRVRRGASAHGEIVAEAREFQADLIVARRRGKPGFLARMVVGEMVSKVVRDVSCSVLLVPRAAQFWQRGILAAVGDTPAAPKIAKLAAAISGACGVPLTILSVAADAQNLSKTQSLNTLNVALASAASKQVQGLVASGKIVEQVVSAARATNADLVVIGRQRYHLIPFASSSIMKNIVGELDMPTLIVPE